MAWICAECHGDGTVYDRFQNKTDCYVCNGRGYTFNYFDGE